MTEEVIIDEILEPAEMPEEPAEPKEQEEERVPKGVQKRIDEITREKHEARRELERERAEAAALRLELERLSRQQPQEEVRTLDNGAPDPDKYAAGKYDPQYLEDLATYKVEQRFQAEQKQQLAQQKQRYIVAKEAEARNNLPDYDQTVNVVMTHPVAQQPWFGSIIADLDDPTGVGYYLGKNPEELGKIAQMSPTQAIRYIGRIEAKLEAPSVEPPKKPVSAAPEPIAPLGSARSSAVTQKDPEKMSMEEYAAWRKGQKKSLSR